MSEPERLNRLGSYCVMDTPADERFDRLTALAADLLQTPIALVSLVDDCRQWFKSRHGTDLVGTPRDQAFCQHVLPLGPGGLLVVNDAARDPRFVENPLVTGEPHIRFYAGAAVASPDGQVLGTLCVIDTEARSGLTPDETRRLLSLAKVVEDQLEYHRVAVVEAEQRRVLELAGRMSGVGHWGFDSRTREVSWSSAVHMLLGLPMDAPTPPVESVADFYEASDRDAFREAMARLAQGAEEVSYRLRIRRTDGELRDVAVTARHREEEGGLRTGLFGVCQDITEYVSAARRVQESERQYQLLADNCTDAIARIGPDGCIAYISPAIETITGHRPEDVLGRAVLEFVHPDDLDRVTSLHHQLAYAAPDAAPKRITYRMQRADGGSVWTESAPKVIRGTSGEALEYVSVVRDVSQRVTAEAELHAARAAAEAAAAAKGQFLANMSHEIRTPLTAVLGFTRLLKDRDDLPESAAGYVRRISGAGNGLLAIVNDILDFSKLEAGKFEIRPRPTDIREVCHETAALFAGQAEAKGLELCCEVDAAPDQELMIDGDRLRQMLINLVGNGVKFTETGEVRLRVAGYVDGQITFEVSDTGPGMTKSSREALFKRFSQIDGSTTRTHGGTGLGLAITRGLAEAMGGRVTVETRRGAGSTFRVELPAVIAEAARAAPASSLPSLESLRVLVVDDNPGNRELAQRMLHVVGSEVGLACDAEEALQRLAAEPFDVVLMDLRMPRMDGRTALDALRSADGPNRHVPVLAFTADADVSATFDLGAFDGLVRKPIDPTNMFDAIAAAVGAPAMMQERAVA